MAGGLSQLVAYGAQDVYLTGSPKITFFKVAYRRHTNFAVESIEQYFNSSIGFGRKSSAEISRSGDLITEVFLRAQLPEVKYCGELDNNNYSRFAWVKNLGHAMIDELELEIGGSQIDKQYGDWLQIWREVSLEVGIEPGLNKMIGNVPELTAVSDLVLDENSNRILKNSYTLFIPLQFYFCRNNGLAIPLIALQYHQVKIFVKFRPVEKCYIATESFKRRSQNLDLTNTSLFVNYIFLDTEERRRFAQVSHEYLIEQVQFTGEESLKGSNSLKYKLNFNHPVKALYFVTKVGNYQGGKFLAYHHEDWEVAREEAAKKVLLAQFDLDDSGNFADVTNNPGSCEGAYMNASGEQYVTVNPNDPEQEPRYVFNDSASAAYFDGSAFIGVLDPSCPLLKRHKDLDLRDKVDGVVRITVDTENNTVVPTVERLLRNDLTIVDLSIPVTKYDYDNRNNYIKMLDLCVWQHDNFGLLIDGTRNPVTEVQLQLNGQDRETKRSAFWYNTVVPYMRHTRTPSDGVNVFSFALNPEEHQPSCTCNFSRIDTAHLNLWFTEMTGSRYGDVFTEDTNVFVYAVNYNILRVMSGMGGLAYSN